MKSELDNIGCLDVIGLDLSKITPEKERKGYHLIVRYLSEEVLGYFLSVLKPEDEGKASVAWKILKEKLAGSTTHAKSLAYNKLHDLVFHNVEQ